MIAPTMDVRDTGSKHSVLAELLEQGMVLVTLDARAQGVDVPAHLREDPQLRLNLSYRFGLPMSLDDEGISATLTFSGRPYDCRLPWHSIYLMVSHVTGRPILFPADVPAELFPQGSEPPAALTLRLGARQPGPPRPRLQLVRGPKESDDDEQTSPKTPLRRGHLRVVK